MIRQFDTSSWTGKWFAFVYGLLLLSIILLPHIDEVIPLLAGLRLSEGQLDILRQLGEWCGIILLLLLLLFFGSTFVYCRQHRASTLPDAEFLIFLTALCILLYCLPLLIGFTFYFVIWHSVLSLSDIVGYLNKEGRQPYKTILHHIIFYSSIALVGLLLLAGGGWVLLDGRLSQTSFLLALALLTVPHMNVMHEMYNVLRNAKGIK